MDRQESPRNAFIAARDAGDERAMLAALERWLAPESLSDEALFELLVLFEAPAFAERNW